MLIHCSRKLAAKLSDVSKEPLPDNSPLGSWHGHLFTVDRRQCVLFCHDQTRFAMFMAGWTSKEFSNLDFWFTDLFANTMLKLGYPAHILEAGVSLLGAPRFDLNTDRSVQGTIRQAALDLEYIAMDAANVMQLSSYATSAELNERPVTIKGMKNSEFLWPVAAMHAHIEKIADEPRLSVVH